MDWLVIGLAIWCGVHFVPGAMPKVKRNLVGTFGPNGYKGLFSFGILAGLALIIIGWRATEPEYLYDPILYPGAGIGIIVFVAFLLMSAAKRPTRLNQYIRHPQLTGVIVWAVGHLLANGEVRTTVLFGTLAIWAVAEIFLINLREGPWQRPTVTVSWLREAFGVVAVIVVVAVLTLLHPYFAGVSVAG